MQRWGPTPKARWGFTVRSMTTESAFGEHRLVAVGRQPAHHEEVAPSEVLAPQLDVVGNGAGQGLVDREVAQELLGGGEQVGFVDTTSAVIALHVEVV